MDRATKYNIDSNFSDRETRIAIVVAEYQAMLESGQRPVRTAFLLQHAELAEELAPCLEALEFVGRIVPVSSLPAPMPSNRLQPNSMVGDFRIVKKIGSGGMGEVYEAQQVSLGRRVALKVLPVASSLDERSLQRFRNEAQAAATLQHPHIVPVYAVGSVGDIHYYAMQYIEGDSLAHVVSTWRTHNSAELETAPSVSNEARGRKPSDLPFEIGPIKQVERLSPTHLDLQGRPFFRDVARMISQAANALQHAHDRGIVHRDIKPGNLLIDNQSDIWVADFGLAKLPDSNLTGTTDVMGTLRYMSPEQASGRAVALDGRTDIYSLGVTLYEMLTLRPVFEAEDRRALLRKVLEEEPRSPRFVCADIPCDLETITLKAMSKESHDRYQSAAEFADDLNRFLNDHPIQAKPQSIRQRTFKWIKRNRFLVGLTTTTILTFMVIGMIGLSIAIFAIDSQRKALKGSLDRETVSLQAANEAKASAIDRLVSEQQARASEENMAYLHSVSLAHVEVKAGNIEAADALLAMSPAYLHDWEWGYVSKLCYNELKVFPIESEFVSGIAKMPSGEFLTYDENGAKIWSFPDGQQVGEWPPFNVNAPLKRTKLASDGKHVFRYTESNRIKRQGKDSTLPLSQIYFVDGASGKLIHTFPVQQGDFFLELSPKDPLLVTSGQDGLIKIWDTRLKELVKSIPGNAVSKIAFSPDAMSFAARSMDGTLSLFRAKTGELLMEIKDSSVAKDRWRSLLFTPDGRSIVSVFNNGNIRFWEAATGNATRTLHLKVGELGELSFSPDGLWLAISDHADHSIRIWNVDSHELVRRLPLRSLRPRDLQFSDDGTILTVLFGKSSVACWDLTTPECGRLLVNIHRQVPPYFAASLFAPCHLSVSDGGKWVALFCKNQVDIYSLETQHWLKSFTAPDSSYVTYAVDLDESRGTLRQLTAKAILHWDLGFDTIQREHSLIGGFATSRYGNFDADEEVRNNGITVCYAPQIKSLGKDGSWLNVYGAKRNGTSDENYWFSVNSTQSDTEDAVFYGSTKGSAYCLTASREGHRFAAAGMNDTNAILAWNAGSERESWSVETPHRVLAMKYNPLGDGLGVADAGGNLKILDAETGQVLTTISFPIQDRAHFAFSPNGKRIAIAVGRPFDNDGEVRVCDVTTGQTLIKIPLDSSAESVEFTPDGKQLLASDYKGRLWVFDSLPRSLANKMQDHQQNKSSWHLDRIAEAELSKNYRAAIWHFDQLLAIQPNDEILATRRTALVAKTGEFANLDAVSADKLERALTLKNLSTAYRLSAEYIARGDAVSHQRLCRRLFAQLNSQTTSSNATQVYRLGTFGPNGVEDLDALIESCKERFSDGSSDSQFALPFLLGTAYFRAGRFEDAKTELTVMLQIKRSSPSYPIALLFLAMTEMRLGNKLLAEDAYSMAEKRFTADKANRRNGEVNYIVDFHYPLLKQEYASGGK